MWLFSRDAGLEEISRMKIGKYSVPELSQCHACASKNRSSVVCDLDDLFRRAILYFWALRRWTAAGTAVGAGRRSRRICGRGDSDVVQFGPGCEMAGAVVWHVSRILQPAVRAAASFTKAFRRDSQWQRSHAVL